MVGLCRSLYVASVFILTIGLARAMGTQEFGSFQQVFIFSAAFIILMLGIPEALYFFLPRLTDDERPRFIGQTLAILALAGTACAVLFWFGAPLLSGIQDNPVIIGRMRLFGIYGAFYIAAAFTDPFFINYGRIGYLFVVNTVHALFFLGITVWYVAAKGSADTLFVSMAVFGGVRYLLSLYLLSRMRSVLGPIRFFGGRSMALLLLSFSLPVMMSTTVEILSRWLDKYVVSFFFGTEALGIFYVGAMEIPFIGVIVSSIYSVVSPVLNTRRHEGDTAGFVRLASKTLSFTAKIVWPLFAWFIVFADHIILLVFTEQYRQAILPFRVYLAMMPLRIASYGVLVIALGRPRLVFWSAAIALGVNFVLNIVFAQTMGMVGPAVATVVSSYFHVALLMIIILRELDAGIGDLIPFRWLFGLGMTCGLSVLIAYGATYTMTDNLAVVLLSFLIFTVAFLFFGSKTGFGKFTDFLDMAGGLPGGTQSDSGNSRRS